MEVQKKYFGILKNFDFENIDKNTMPLLINAGIFNEIELSPCYIDMPKVKNEEEEENEKETESKYFGVEKFENSPFSDLLLFNHKEYHLKKEILIEMIKFKEEYLKACWELESVYFEIDEAVNKCFLQDEKILAIKEKHDKYYKIIDDTRIYNLYKFETVSYDYDNWFDLFEEKIIDDGHFESIEKYLKGNTKYLPEKLEKTWNNCYSFLKISEYCEIKRKELEVPGAEIKPMIMENQKNEKSATKRDLSFRLSYFEELMKYGGWDDLNPTLKGKILTHLLGDYPTNIRDFYAEMNKTTLDKFKEGEKWDKDRKEAEITFKNLTG